MSPCLRAGSAQTEVLNMSTNLSAVALVSAMEAEVDAARLANLRLEQLVHVST
jgi:hypothetical protein